MSLEKIVKTILTWIPSLIVSVFYIQNAIDKMFKTEALDKVVKHPIILMGVGGVLFIANLLFLINKTILWGASILALYMFCIVFIHINKGKPFEGAMLITMCTVFAAYIRQPEVFKLNEK